VGLLFLGASATAQVEADVVATDATQALSNLEQLHDEAVAYAEEQQDQAAEEEDIYAYDVDEVEELETIYDFFGIPYDEEDFEEEDFEEDQYMPIADYEEGFEPVKVDGAWDLPPCMQDVSDDDAMQMEGDLTRVLVVPLGGLLSSNGPDPISQWLDQQLFMLREMPFALPLSAPQPMFQETEPLDYDEDTELSLSALASVRFMPAMQDLMQAERTAETTDSGIMEDGTRWSSAEGSTANGRWYRFSMSLGEPEANAEAPSAMEASLLEELPGYQSTAPMWNLPEMVRVGVHEQHHRGKHAACMAAFAGVAVVLAVTMGRSRWSGRGSETGAGLSAGSASVAQPLLSPLSPERPAKVAGAVVVAADHADLEKHYVDIAYVPLKGEN